MTPDDTSRPPLGHPSRPLDPTRLAGAPAPWRVEVAEELPSTNTELARRAREGEPEGAVLVAERQTGGRGRLGRTWVTPPGTGLAFSVLLRPTVPDPRWPWLPLLTGLAVREGVVAAGGPPCELKWPNDVLHDGLKLAGLLTERVDTPDGPAAVVGVGLNVSTQRRDLPVETATSLLLAGLLVADRSAILLAVLDSLGARYRAWQAAAGDPRASGLAPAYTAACDTVGSEVRVQLPGGREVTGRALEVDPDGALVVSADGNRVVVSAGDVVHVRPHGVP